MNLLLRSTFLRYEICVSHDFGHRGCDTVWTSFGPEDGGSMFSRRPDWTWFLTVCGQFFRNQFYTSVSYTTLLYLWPVLYRSASHQCVIIAFFCLWLVKLLFLLGPSFTLLHSCIILQMLLQLWNRGHRNMDLSIRFCIQFETRYWLCRQVCHSVHQFLK
jgi:hypothetical protein